MPVSARPGPVLSPPLMPAPAPRPACVRALAATAAEADLAGRVAGGGLPDPVAVAREMAALLDAGPAAAEGAALRPVLARLAAYADDKRITRYSRLPRPIQLAWWHRLAHELPAAVRSAIWRGTTRAALDALDDGAGRPGARPSSLSEGVWELARGTPIDDATLLWELGHEVRGLMADRPDLPPDTARAWLDGAVHGPRAQDTRVALSATARLEPAELEAALVRVEQLLHGLVPPPLDAGPLPLDALTWPATALMLLTRADVPADRVIAIGARAPYGFWTPERVRHLVHERPDGPEVAGAILLAATSDDDRLAQGAVRAMVEGVLGSPGVSGALIAAVLAARPTALDASALADWLETRVVHGPTLGFSTEQLAVLLAVLPRASRLRLLQLRAVAAPATLPWATAPSSGRVRSL